MARVEHLFSKKFSVLLVSFLDPLARKSKILLGFYCLNPLVFLVALFFSSTPEIYEAVRKSRYLTSYTSLGPKVLCGLSSSFHLSESSHVVYV